jgi:uncharacterized membrane protein YdjX (TVP38/TMEM64 family)
MGKDNQIEKFVKSEKEFIIYEWNYWKTLLTVLAIFLTLYLILTDSLTYLLDSIKNYGYFGSYFAGFLYSETITSIFSIAIFFTLAEEGLNPWLLSFIGALGAMSYDYIIFNYVKNKSGKSIKIHNKKYKIPEIKSKFLRKISPLIAGLIIASPLPDELAAVLFGFEHYSVKKFIILSFVFNFLGILIITLLGAIF